MRLLVAAVSIGLLQLLLVFLLSCLSLAQGRLSCAEAMVPLSTLLLLELSAAAALAAAAAATWAIHHVYCSWTSSSSSSSSNKGSGCACPLAATLTDVAAKAGCRLFMRNFGSQCTSQLGMNRGKKVPSMLQTGSSCF
uniref:Secreted protein n=1 Tax=Tetradesmus obliquus TaxID=3088 RepID=A0A383WQE0_TETOB|eukprot:jgi/Sobl393_1/13288/SZX79206.1